MRQTHQLPSSSSSGRQNKQSADGPKSQIQKSASRCCGGTTTTLTSLRRRSGMKFQTTFLRMQNPNICSNTEKGLKFVGGKVSGRREDRRKQNEAYASPRRLCCSPVGSRRGERHTDSRSELAVKHLYKKSRPQFPLQLGFRVLVLAHQQVRRHSTQAVKRACLRLAYRVRLLLSDQLEIDLIAEEAKEEDLIPLIVIWQSSDERFQVLASVPRQS